MPGSIIKRGDFYSVVISTGRDENGKRLRQWHSGYRTRKAAEVARIELVNSIQQGTYVIPKKVSLGDYLDSWLRQRRALGLPTNFGGFLPL